MKLTKEQKAHFEILRNAVSKRFARLGFADGQLVIKTKDGKHVSIEFERCKNKIEHFKVFIEDKMIVFVHNSNFLTSGQFVNLINATLKNENGD